MAQIPKQMQQKCQVNCFRLFVTFVVKNVFSCLRNTDSNIYSQSGADKLFHMTELRTAKLRSISISTVKTCFNMTSMSKY